MVGGSMTKFISINTTDPTKKSEVFSTAADSQIAIKVKTYQGKCELVSSSATSTSSTFLPHPWAFLKSRSRCW